MQYNKKSFERIIFYGLNFLGFILYAYIFIVGIKGVSFFGSFKENVISPIYIVFLVFFILYYYDFNFLMIITNKKSTKNIKKIKKLFLLNSVLNILWICAWMYELSLAAFIFSAIRLFTIYILSDLINKNKTKSIKNSDMPALQFSWASIIFSINLLYLFVYLRIIFGYNNEYFVILFLTLNFIMNLMYYLKYKNKKGLCLILISYSGIFLKTLLEYGFYIRITYIFEILFILILIILTIRSEK